MKPQRVVCAASCLAAALLVCRPAAAFVPQGLVRPSSAGAVSRVVVPSPRAAAGVVRRATSEEAAIIDKVESKIHVSGHNIEVTPAMKDYVEKKLGKVLAKGIVETLLQRIDVHLSVVTSPKGKGHLHTAEATVFMKGGQVLRSKEETDYMYASIDLVSHRLARHLRRFKDRKLAARKDAQFSEAAPENLALGQAGGAGAAAGDFEDPARLVDLRLVKTKTFDMPPMTVEDAIVCLDYIGHDFYVFRNDKTSDINVVYKRREGGVGLIQPSDR